MISIKVWKNNKPNKAKQNKNKIFVRYRHYISDNSFSFFVLLSFFLSRLHLVILRKPHQSITRPQKTRSSTIECGGTRTNIARTKRAGNCFHEPVKRKSGVACATSTLYFCLFSLVYNSLLLKLFVVKCLLKFFCLLIVCRCCRYFFVALCK